jgi:hypothetical protein
MTIAGGEILDPRRRAQFEPAALGVRELARARQNVAAISRMIEGPAGGRSHGRAHLQAGVPPQDVDGRRGAGSDERIDRVSTSSCRAAR